MENDKHRGTDAVCSATDTRAPGTRDDSASSAQIAEEGSARRRVLNLLSRHPDVIAGRLDRVASILCEESALATGCQRVGLWQASTESGVDLLRESDFNGRRFEDQVERSVTRDDAPAFFAGLERRRLLNGSALLDFQERLEGGMAATVNVDNAVWGMLTFERATEGPWNESELDFALLVAGMVGRCQERGLRAQLGRKLERAEEALGAFSRMMGDALSFEVVNGKLESQGDPRLLLGPPPVGQVYEIDLLFSHIREDQRDVLMRRFRDWEAAGSPGVLSARVSYAAGCSGSTHTELELDCRLMRVRSAEGVRLWGVLRRG